MKSSELALQPVRHSIEVGLRPAAAFRVFVEQIDSWWPLALHAIGPGKATGCHFEGRVGGRIYETHDDGALHLWGTVTEWQPPRRIVFSWHPGRGADTAQEVELRFGDLGTGTRVELEHRAWAALGERAAEARDAYQSGWPGVLTDYARRCSLVQQP
jgi:uncharacterized protein YndB with AHSA1/START domain